MVETEKPDTPAAEGALEVMRRETEAILVTSAKLLKDLEQLIETSRQLRAAQQALLEERRKNKRGE